MSSNVLVVVSAQDIKMFEHGKKGVLQMIRLADWTVAWKSLPNIQLALALHYYYDYDDDGDDDDDDDDYCYYYYYYYYY